SPGKRVPSASRCKRFALWSSRPSASSTNALDYPAMPGERQLSIWMAFGLWTVAVASAAVYGAWHGYRGRAYAVTLCVLGFFLAVQLSLAAGNFGERFARRAG